MSEEIEISFAHFIEQHPKLFNCIPAKMLLFCVLINQIFIIVINFILILFFYDTHTAIIWGSFLSIEVFFLWLLSDTITYPCRYYLYLYEIWQSIMTLFSIGFLYISITSNFGAFIAKTAAFEFAKSYFGFATAVYSCKILNFALFILVAYKYHIYLWQFDSSHSPPTYENPNAICYGFSKDELKHLPRFQITTDEIEKHLHCTTCLEKFDVLQEVSKLDCNHIFHKRCIKTWLLKNPTCPICRTLCDPKAWHSVK